MSQGPVDYPYKFINDSIHGHVRIDRAVLDFVDTEQFQRLRNLKQLGSSYLVFPGAAHNRFEHSLGVCHLAGSLVERFRTQQPYLEITDADVHCIKVAGLCHDLGHGPFSHVFDNEFIPRARPGLSWTHEQASEMMFDALIDENHIDMDPADCRFVKDLIAGQPRTHADDSRHERGFLYEIVANKRNSVDVDKFDYIERDCYNVGLKSSYDFDRLMTFSRVIDNEICYHSKEVYNLYEMFHTRYSLFKRIYTHRVAKAAEFMIVDAMVEADPYLGISAAIDDPQRYLHLTDSVLHDISSSTRPELAKARDILRNMRMRNLYRFVDEVLVPVEVQAYLRRDAVTPARILEFRGDNEGHVVENDIIVQWFTINYAMKDKNPVDHIRFYSRYNDDTAYHVSRQKVSFLVPDQYEETILRVFTRSPEKMAVIQRIFRAWVADGPLSKVANAPAVTPNPTLTVPLSYESPRKRALSQQSMSGSLSKRSLFQDPDGFPSM